MDEHDERVARPDSVTASSIATMAHPPTDTSCTCVVQPGRFDVDFDFDVEQRGRGMPEYDGATPGKLLRHGRE